MSDVIRPPRTQKPALRGAVVVSTVRGSPRVSKWPRKRGTPTHPHTLYMNGWFRVMMRRLKYAPGPVVDQAIDMAKGRSVYPRDMMLTQVTSPMWRIPQDDGSYLEQRTQGVWQVSFQGARVQLNATQTLTMPGPKPVAWDIPEFDTLGMWEGTQPTRLVIPNGVNICRFEGAMLTTTATATNAHLTIRRNGSETLATQRQTSVLFGAAQVDTGPIAVSPGDYVELVCEWSATRTLDGTLRNYLTCDVLDASIPNPPTGL